MIDNKIALRFKNISFRFGSEYDMLLNKINFDLHYGEFILLTGSSGCGKSSLINIASGIIPNIYGGELSGDVYIDNESIEYDSVGAICHKLGVVLQNPDSQIFHPIMEDEIAFGCENFAFDPEKTKLKINEVSSLIKLDPKSHTRRLSGGQKQKLVTGSIIAMEQKIILLDEPLANLDRQSAIDLLKVLSELVDKHNYAVLISEHRLDLTAQYVDKVYTLKNKELHQLNKTSFKKESLTDVKKMKTFDIDKQTILSINNLSCTIKKNQILDDANFEIYKGEKIVLLGENGSGKTTLMRLMSKIISPTKGNIKQFIDPKLKQRKRGNKKWFNKIGVVYQNPNYQLFMPTVMRELSFNSLNNELLNDIIEKFKLHDILDRHPQTLSEGQKRKVTIAAVLTSKPEILFLDEPTVGQDYANLEIILSILEEFNVKYGMTIVTITHDPTCAMKLCDRAIIIKEKHIFSQGGKEVINEYLKMQSSEKNN